VPALHIGDLHFMVSNVRDAKIVLSLSLTSSAKTIIYPNSLILERQGSTFLRKKGRMKNLPIGVVGRFIAEAMEVVA
jgi:hypothetical protein